MKNEPDSLNVPHVPGQRIGCAGWSIPKAVSHAFPKGVSQLQRYAQVFNAVEVNSSFYRNHQPQTYERWADAVPAPFRFSVKIPRAISHQAKLHDCHSLLSEFLDGVERLGAKLGTLLLQLPPRLAWDPSVAIHFFTQLRALHEGPVVCEPRHISWFTYEVSHALAKRRIGRIAADPALCLRAQLPGGDHHIEYVRLHGSPRMYYDPYSDAILNSLAARLQKPSAGTIQRWCMFDNTALGHATVNALSLCDLVR
jgi:uncharacterized protein YecE (DUF72 family)